METNINESNNLITQTVKTKCPNCLNVIKLDIPPEFINWHSAYIELEDRYNKLKAYVETYSEWLEKQIGYYPEDQYVIELLTNLIQNIKKTYPYIKIGKIDETE